MLSVKETVQSKEERASVPEQLVHDIPDIPLRILMVLGSDFDKPRAVGRTRTFETTCPFRIGTKLRKDLSDKIPGFISYSFYDSKTKQLQANLWVRLQLCQETFPHLT